uniref:Serine-threonine/tyrosine-protein kinase catalytic domain-containing protein n=1 Tax=Leersia perrieri TaxID=77586 RepID=A0A0D9W671_9ORYZ
MKMVESFITVALWCIQDKPTMRPTMLKVNRMLDGAIEAPQPPLNTPAFIVTALRCHKLINDKQQAAFFQNSL